MNSFGESKYGYVALAVSLSEIAVIWGGQGIVYAAGAWGNAPHWLADLFVLMYLAGLGAPVIAIIGLVKDARRLPAGVALLLSVLTLVVCSIPIAGLR